MNIAVVTPTYRTPTAWLAQCLESVRRQTVACTHFVVNDGDPDLVLPPGSEGVHVASVPGPHRDVGNTARAVGSICAICRGFDAIAYLDADNWYQPHHLELQLRMQQLSGAAVCTSGRTLHHLDGTMLGTCYENDGQHFVDTNCLFLTRAAFDLLPLWYTVPAGQRLVADRFIWREIVRRGQPRAHLEQATVAYRTAYAAHYEYFGLKPPTQARTLTYLPQQQRWELDLGDVA
jgi:glycosyltransferase involved in cell wall biosynthesis